MTVLFISDFGLCHSSGGAQVSNDLIFKKGQELGYDVVFFHYDSSPVYLLYPYDLVISSNLEAISFKSPEVFEFILKHPNHVRLEHDSCLYLTEQARKDLFQSSKKNFFLSDFHLDFFKNLYGDIFPNPEIVYDPIDTSVFYDNGSEKEYDIVYAGYIHPLKGIFNLCSAAQANPDRKFDVFGWASDESCFSAIQDQANIILHEPVSHTEIADIYRKSRNIFHWPVVNEPFCRMVGEALLCGCDFMGDQYKVGSYLEFVKNGKEEFARKSSTAAETFWQKLA